MEAFLPQRGGPRRFGHPLMHPRTPQQWRGAGPGRRMLPRPLLGLLGWAASALPRMPRQPAPLSQASVSVGSSVHPCPAGRDSSWGPSPWSLCHPCLTIGLWTESSFSLGPVHTSEPGTGLINRELVRKVGRKARLVVHDSMERDVGLLRLYPGIPASLVRAFLQPPMKGLVMETFGSGNGPTKPDLLRELRAAAERGLVIVNCTHCLQGTVTSDYATGMAMAGAGIVSGLDMTSEAALAKLSYVLGQPGLSLDDRKELLAKDLRGEMTPPTADERRPSLLGSTWGRGVAWLLGLSGSQEADAVLDALMPSLACAAAHAGDLEALQVLAAQGSDLSLEDFRGQTPLHAAARGGRARVVGMLLQRGVDVNARDEDGLSPLLLAVRGRHLGVIGLLRAAGACLSAQELEDLGTELCRLAARADGDGLRAWWQAGADLQRSGYDGRSALHVAEAAGNLEVVAFLQSLAVGVTAEAPGPRGCPVTDQT
ncbi:PREDICTED: 60 kDa lysophospholipase isoform X6 [Propithecus coquereli]|uniref:60 kDa lysophospholipase isoform X6 n=1 Tax=Propithecus coquereli TaxID=379532 RepID=UPI00063F800A|nr:PREDICTED: 60 kDa lysophospholipase isoform X6 [Propithecus coquereli]